MLGDTGSTATKRERRHEATEREGEAPPEPSLANPEKHRRRSPRRNSGWKPNAQATHGCRRNASDRLTTYQHVIPARL